MTPPGEPLADPITELRRLTDVLLDRLQPWLSTPDTLRDHSGAAPGDVADPDPTPSPPSQGPCPLCALLTAVRGDRAELTRRLTTHGLTALATLRELLLRHTDHTNDPDHHHAAPDPGDETAPTPTQAQPTPFAQGHGGPFAEGPAHPQVHHIPVRRPHGDTRTSGSRSGGFAGAG